MSLKILSQNTNSKELIFYCSDLSHQITKIFCTCPVVWNKAKYCVHLIWNLKKKKNSLLKWPWRVICTQSSTGMTLAVWNLNIVSPAHKYHHFNGIVQERCNSSALAMELCISCTNLLIYYLIWIFPCDLNYPEQKWLIAVLLWHHEASCILW